MEISKQATHELMARLRSDPAFRQAMTTDPLGTASRAGIVLPLDPLRAFMSGPRDERSLPQGVTTPHCIQQPSKQQPVRPEHAPVLPGQEPQSPETTPLLPDEPVEDDSDDPDLPLD